MSLLSALFICSTDGGGCKNALLNAGLNDPEALFLYRIWDEIPDQRAFSSNYLSILTNRGVKLEIRTLYDRYLLAVMLERKNQKEKAAEEYYIICSKAEGLLSAECCYRAYKLGKKEAGEFLKGYYRYFLE
jgi:hypothetical protein